MINTTRKAVMTIANTLVYKFNTGRSEAMKQAWKMVKSGFSCKVSAVTYLNRQRIISELNLGTAGAYIQRENNRCNKNSLIVVVNETKMGYLNNKVTAIVYNLLLKGLKVKTQVLNVIGGEGLNYGLTVGLKLVA